MKQALRRCLVATVLLSTAAGLASAAEPGLIPVGLSVTATPNELNAGGTSSVRVQLKNYRGDTIAAPDEVTVTLHSALSGDATVVIKAGASAAQTQVTFRRGGVATLVATAANLASATTAVVVRAGADEAAAATVASPSAPAGGAKAARPPGGATAPTPPGVRLAITVIPDHVHPFNATWTAKVLVTAQNQNSQPVAVVEETPIQLATDIGLVTPSYTTVAPGHAAPADIQVTSKQTGTGTVWAWTDTGELARAAVEYDSPVATQLLLKALPPRTVNDGRTAVAVTVFLQDDASNTVRAVEDLEVKLTSSVGTPKPSTLMIPKGQFVGEAVLTSATAGHAEITATAPNLKSAVATADFVFPYTLVLMASIGGLVGGLVRSTGETFTGKWWWHLLGSVGIGTILGLLFYLLAAFGILSLIPKIPAPLEQLPTTNALVALVLGFFGGYWARRWLPDLPTSVAGTGVQPSANRG